MAGISPKVSGLFPSSASPVLKEILSIMIENFNNEIVYSDISVTLISVLDPTIIMPINIVNIDNTPGNKSIQVKYGGAQSGNYTLNVTSTLYGSFDTSTLIF